MPCNSAYRQQVTLQLGGVLVGSTDCMKQVSYIMATGVHQKCTLDVHDVIHNDIRGLY